LNDMSEEKLTEYWNEILKFKPRWVHGPSTAIYNIARHVKINNLERFEFELIELNGEFVQEHHFELIKEVMGENVAIHYGSREFWAIAFSCENNQLHILDNNLFIEQVYNEEFHTYELLVTTLTNHAWSLIRYRIGDFGEIKLSDHDQCNGKGKYILELKSGRKADYFSLDGGITINAILFSGILRGLSSKDQRYHVNQYQIIKHAGNHLTLKLSIKEQNKTFTDHLIERCELEVRKVIPKSIQIDYEIVDIFVPDSRTGKCKDFVDASKMELNI
jgi:phenylacetate-CoA ligase